MSMGTFDTEKLHRMQEKKEKQIKKQEDNAPSSRLPEIFYKPIKVKRYLKFNREELHRDV